MTLSWPCIDKIGASLSICHNNIDWSELQLARVLESEVAIT